jgi:hypothetical protein
MHGKKGALSDKLNEEKRQRTGKMLCLIGLGVSSQLSEEQSQQDTMEQYHEGND